MSTNLTKDLVFLLAGVILTLGLESQVQLIEHHIGSEQTSLLLFVVFVSLLGGYLIFRRYIEILGAGGHPVTSLRRRAYDDLRSSLKEEGTPARIYAKGLEKMLHTVERLFGDDELAKGSLLSRWLGLGTPARLWTAPAMDRCILLAFIYPQTAIFVIWVISGRVGSAENVLGLPDELTFWPRAAALSAIVVASIGFSKCYGLATKLLPTRKSKGKSQTKASTKRAVNLNYWRQFAQWSFVFLVGALVTDWLLGHTQGAVGGSVGLSSSVVGIVTGDVAVALASAFGGAVVGAIMVLATGTFKGAIAGSIASTAIGLAAAAINIEKSLGWRRLRHNSAALSFFLTATVVICIWLGFKLSSQTFWSLAGPIILFYALLSALNAPFLWFSLGLTRALLWLGLERRGWWPYFYALLDAAVAVVIVLLLVAVMLIGVQTLGLAATMGGGKPVLLLQPLLDGIARNPAAPQFWWVYALLLSTIIPSLINLTVGGFSLVRGIPALSKYLYAHLPAGAPVAPVNRTWIALVLMVQWMIGILLGVGAQFFLFFWIVGHVIPGFGTSVLHFAFTVVDWNIPAQVLRLF
jgi:hypothetical protein